MTDSAIVTLGGVIASVLVHASLVVFYYGRMTEKVSNLSQWASDLERKSDDHGQRISRIEGHLGIKPE